MFHELDGQELLVLLRSTLTILPGSACHESMEWKWIGSRLYLDCEVDCIVDCNWIGKRIVKRIMDAKSD